MPPLLTSDLELDLEFEKSTGQFGQPEAAAIAQHLLERQGYVIVGNYGRDVLPGDILAHVWFDDFQIPGPCIVIGTAEPEEWVAQCRYIDSIATGERSEGYRLSPGMMERQAHACMSIFKVRAE